MKFQPVFRKDGRLIRLFRVMWIRGHVGDGVGYSVKLSIGLYPRLLKFERGWEEWRLWIAGLRIHAQRSYGGIHV